MAQETPPPSELRTKELLSPEARREKRALLGFSSLSLFLLWTGSLQETTNVSIQGNVFALEREHVLVGLLILVVYFLIAYGAYAVFDLSARRVALRASEELYQLDDELAESTKKLEENRRDLEEYKQKKSDTLKTSSDEKAKKYAEQVQGSISNKEHGVLEADRAVRKLEARKQALTGLGSGKLYLARIALDFAVPFLVGAAAVIALGITLCRCHTGPLL